MSRLENIPLLREAMRALQPVAPIQAKGPALISIFIFLFFIVLGLILNTQLSHESHTPFLIFFIMGGFVSSLTYIFAKKIFRADSQQNISQFTIRQYDSLLGRMHGWGFSAASSTAQNYIQLCLRLHALKPSLFYIADDTIHAFLVAFSQIGQSKILIGNEYDLKNHCERVVQAIGTQTSDLPPKNMMAARVELAALELRIEKLEDIAKCALALSEQMKLACKTTQKIVSSSNSNELDAQLLLQEKSSAVEKIQSEMSRIGL